MGSENLQNSYREIERVVHAELFPDLTKPKVRDRAVSILEAAIESYRVVGIENTTYERIAERAGISRPLIFKYFTDYEDIFYKSVKLIRVHFQTFAVAAIRKHKTPTEMLRAYIESTFDWIERYPSYASGLLLYLQRCSWDERNRDLNTQFAEAGRSRIAALVRLGVEAKQFNADSPDVIAKQLQTIIAGALVTAACEVHPDKRKYRREILVLCLGLVGVKIDSD